MLTSWTSRNQVFLVRHAQSVGQIAGAVTASHDLIPLTSLGRAQASAFALSVSTAPSLIVSSPFVRALETAAPLRARYPSVPFAIWPVQEFTYLDPARCFMTTGDGRQAMRRSYRELSDPAYRAGAGAESFDDFVARATAFIDRARSLRGGATYVFTHAFFMRLVELLLGGPPADRRAFMRAFLADPRAPTIGNLATVTLP